MNEQTETRVTPADIAAKLNSASIKRAIAIAVTRAEWTVTSFGKAICINPGRKKKMGGSKREVRDAMESFVKAGFFTRERFGLDYRYHPTTLLHETATLFVELQKAEDAKPIHRAD